MPVGVVKAGLDVGTSQPKLARSLNLMAPDGGAVACCKMGRYPGSSGHVEPVANCTAGEVANSSTVMVSRHIQVASVPSWTWPAVNKSSAAAATDDPYCCCHKNMDCSQRKLTFN